MKVLLVDDDRELLQGLQRVLAGGEPGWQIDACGRDDAEQRIARGAYDALATGPRPAADKLRKQAARWRPQMLQLRWGLGAEHAPPTEDSPQAELQASLTRACLLHRIMQHPRFNALITRLASLPSLPSLYNELLDEVESPQGTISRVGELVSRDPAMSAKVLRMANSAGSGLRSRVDSPHRAASLLGLDAIKTLALSGRLFNINGRQDATSGPRSRLEKLMDHSLQVALMARAIAHREEADDGQFNEAFTAGLLHDIGKMVLLETASDDFERSLTLARQRQIPQVEAERQLLGCCHATLGAHLLALWGLPAAVTLAVSRHHSPQPGTGYSSAAAVAAANLAEHARDIPARAPRLKAQLERLQLLGRFERWRRNGLLNLSLD